MHYVLLLCVQTRSTESNPQNILNKYISFLELKGVGEDTGKHYKKVVSKL